MNTDGHDESAATITLAIKIRNPGHETSFLTAFLHHHRCLMSSSRIRRWSIQILLRWEIIEAVEWDDWSDLDIYTLRLN